MSELELIQAVKLFHNADKDVRNHVLQILIKSKPLDESPEQPFDIDQQIHDPHHSERNHSDDIC